MKKIPVFTMRVAFFSFLYPDVWVINPAQKPELVEIKIKERPRAVILDADMASLVFTRTYNEIRKLVGFYDIPTIIITYGHSDEVTGCHVANNEKSLKKFVEEYKNKGN